MNKEIKLIALDLDGTLLNSSKEISKENRLAINAARQKGVQVVLTTGRPLIAIQPFLKTLEMLDFEDFSITFNGGLVKRNTGQILSKKSFSHDEILEIKASGGIKTLEDAEKFIEAGATRIGTSSGVKIMNGCDCDHCKCEK